MRHVPTDCSFSLPENPRFVRPVQRTGILGHEIKGMEHLERSQNGQKNIEIPNNRFGSKPDAHRKKSILFDTGRLEMEIGN